jgi:hypothetical protein
MGGEAEGEKHGEQTDEEMLHEGGLRNGDEAGYGGANADALNSRFLYADCSRFSIHPRHKSVSA